MNCPRCNHSQIYKIARHDRRRCANPLCRFEFSETAGTAKHGRKKPHDWYAKIIGMKAQGMNAYKIACALGDPRNTYKSVWAFLKRWENERARH